MKHWCMIYSIESKIEFATDPKCCFIFESRYTVYIYTQTYIFRYIYIYIDGYTYKYCIAFLIKFSWKYMFFAWSFPIPHTNILAGWSGCNSVSVWDEPLRNGYRFCAMCEGDRVGVAAWSNEISIQKVCGIGLKHQLALDSNDPITWRL